MSDLNEGMELEDFLEAIREAVTSAGGAPRVYVDGWNPVVGVRAEAGRIVVEVAVEEWPR